MRRGQCASLASHHDLMSAPINVAGPVEIVSRRQSPHRIARTAPPFLHRSQLG
jgi:hypothetical protein